MKKLLSLILSILMLFGVAQSVFAATPTIDTSRTASLTVYKYDQTKAAENSGWTPESFVSTGYANSAAQTALSPYAIEGVRFSYIKVGTIETLQRTNAAGRAEILAIYGLNNAVASVLGLGAAQAEKTVSGVNYYTSDTIANALQSKLSSAHNATKDALEAIADGGTPMPATDASGRSTVAGLELGLYLLVETTLPNQICVTTDPFFVSLPMSNHVAANVNDWNYDVVVYPKNQTDEPTLLKEVAEVVPGQDPVYSAEYATASEGDTVRYRITTSLQKISSTKTYYKVLRWEDVLNKGVTYKKNDVVLRWYANEAALAASTVAATWTEEDSTRMFRVTYEVRDNDDEYMKIELTQAGLNVVNGNASKADYTDYSGYIVVIGYEGTLDSDASATLGKDNNPNHIVFTYQREGSPSVSTLADDATVYTWGMDITKLFSDGALKGDKVQFTLKNVTDNYFVQATGADGIYYASGTGSDPYVFSPSASGELKIHGLENDRYELTEVQTASGYTLLKNSILITISKQEVRNAQNELTDVVASAVVTVAGVDNTVTMTPSGTSENAFVPMTIVNERGYDLPITGESGVIFLPIIGLVGAGVLFFLGFRRKEKENR